jgi:hypothetical protein
MKKIISLLVLVLSFSSFAGTYIEIGTTIDSTDKYELEGKSKTKFKGTRSTGKLYQDLYINVDGEDLIDLEGQGEPFNDANNSSIEVLDQNSIRLSDKDLGISKVLKAQVQAKIKRGKIKEVNGITVSAGQIENMVAEILEDQLLKEILANPEMLEKLINIREAVNNGQFEIDFYNKGLNCSKSEKKGLNCTNLTEITLIFDL